MLRFKSAPLLCLAVPGVIGEVEFATEDHRSVAFLARGRDGSGRSESSSGREQSHGHAQNGRFRNDSEVPPSYSEILKQYGSELDTNPAIPPIAMVVHQ
jgi:hypothetical protein